MPITIIDDIGLAASLSPTPGGPPPGFRPRIIDDIGLAPTPAPSPTPTPAPPAEMAAALGTPAAAPEPAPTPTPRPPRILPGNIIDDIGLVEGMQAEAEAAGPSMAHRAVSVGLTTGLPIVGGMVGTAFGMPHVGAMGGGFVGELGRQWWDDEEMNLKLAGVEGALNRFNPPGAPGFWQNVFQRGVQGAGQAAVGEIPRELARTGTLPSWAQMGEQAAYGATIGAAFGGAEVPAVRYLEGKKILPGNIIDDIGLTEPQPMALPDQPAQPIPPPREPYKFVEGRPVDQPRVPQGQNELFGIGDRLPGVPRETAAAGAEGTLGTPQPGAGPTRPGRAPRPRRGPAGEPGSLIPGMGIVEGPDAQGDLIPRQPKPSAPGGAGGEAVPIPTERKLLGPPQELPAMSNGHPQTWFDIMGEDGTPQAAARVEYNPDKKSLYVHWLGDNPRAPGEEAPPLGPGKLRRVLLELGEQFPEAETIDFDRITGRHKGPQSIRIPGRGQNVLEGGDGGTGSASKQPDDAEAPSRAATEALTSEGKPTEVAPPPGETLPRKAERQMPPGAEDITGPRPSSAPAARPGYESYAFGNLDPESRYHYRYGIERLDDLQAEAPDVQIPGRRETEKGAQDVAASEYQIQHIVNTFDPEVFLEGNRYLHTGVPIVGRDLKVESGNGRTKILRKLRNERPEVWAEFMDEQRRQAARFGLDPNDIKDGDVIIRERLTPVENRQLFAAEANKSAGMASSAVENAHVDALRLNDSDIANLHIGEGQTVDSALKLSGNAGVVRKILAGVPKGDLNQFVDTKSNQLQPTGIARIKAALLARTFGEGDRGKHLVRALIEQSGENIRNVETAIYSTLGKWAKVQAMIRKGERPADLDMTEDVTAAVTQLASLKSAGTNVDLWLQNHAMFEKSSLTPFQRRLLEQFNLASRSALRLKRFMSGLTDEVIEFNRPQKSMFGGDDLPIDKDAIFDAALRRAGETGGRSDIGAVAGGPRQRRKETAEDRAPTGKPRRTFRDFFKGEQSGYGATPPPPAGSKPTKFDTKGRPIVEGGALSSDRVDALARSLNENLESPEQVNQVRDAVAAHIRSNVEYARRGVVPVQTTLERATALGLTPEELLKRKRGQALNDEQLAAAVILNEKQLHTAMQAADAAVKNPDDGAAQAKFLHHVYTLYATMQQATGAVAEAGRALRILRELKRDPQLKGLQRAIELTKGKRNMPEVIKRFTQIDPNDVGAMNRYLSTLVEANAWDKAYEVWVNALLSGPGTHLVNAISNAVFTLDRPLMKGFQVGADVIRHATTGADRERFAAEIGADFTGMYRGIRTSGRAALQSFRDELDHIGGEKILEASDVKQAVGGRLGRVVRLPVRLLRAADQFFKGINSQGQLYALATRRAIQEGHTGDALTARVADIVARPQQIDGLLDAVKKEALYRTFQDSGGLEDDIIRFRNRSELGRYIVPFVTTPLRIANAGVERSPFALLSIMKRAHAGTLAGADLNDALVRSAVGTTAAASVAMLVGEDLVTGFGPTDPKKRAAWRASGKQPYSFKLPQALIDRLPDAVKNALDIKGQWVNYGRIEPLGMVLGVGADFGELLKENNANTLMDVGDAARKLGFLFGKNLSSKTFLKGLSGFMNAIDDPDRYGEQFLEDFAGTIVPNIVTQTMRGHDAVVRRPRSISQVLQSRTGLGAGGVLGLEEVPPLRDVFGEPVMRVGSSLERALSPIPRSYTREDEPARAELSRLKLSVGYPEREIADVKLTDGEFDKYIALSGQVARKLIGREVLMPGYKQKDDVEKAERLHELFRDARKEARNRLRMGVTRRQRVGGGVEDD